MYRVDLNCDMGESFGAYQLGADEELVSLVSSVNIACGFHAGDPATMRKTVELSLQKGAALGAHPGLPDLIGFGRRNMEISPQEAYDMVVYQIGALQAFVQAQGAQLQHVKPHGALYNMASKQPDLARAIAEAVYRVNPELILFGLSGGELVKAGNHAGLRTASEVFADRTYRQDGSLTPRRHEDALITDPVQAAKQVIRMVQEGKVLSRQGVEVSLVVDTICIHGDGTHAALFARKIREQLETAGVAILPVGQ